jgi:phosphatidate cytidylyltransferase
MINRIKLFFDKNVFHRIITGILFIVPFILFILNGGYLFIFYFLLVLSILIEEFNAEAINKINSKLRFLLTFILIFSIFHFIFLRISNDSGIVQYILYIIFSIWIFDSFSLIGGKLIGGKKLIPTVSPNKTYSGLLIGFLSLLLFSVVTVYIFSVNELLIICTISIGAISFLGDAGESYLKRYLNIKDFSNLLPGHGGLLDRMDAFILIFFVHFIALSLNIISINLYA